MFDREKYQGLFNVARLVKRVGWRRADELLAFTADYKQFMRVHERAPTGFEEYVAWTRLYSRRTAYRRLALLHAAFPELGADSKPEDFMVGFLDQIQAEIEAADE